MRALAFLRGPFSFYFFSLSFFLHANKGPNSSVLNTPKEVFEKLSYDPTTGDLRVSQINTCGTIDRIPWTVKSSGKRTRRIFRDYLKKDGEKTYSLWELTQVLGEKGDVSFIFQKKLRDGRSEFYALRGYQVERILEVRKGRRRLVDKQSMKALINRVGAVFFHKDGSRVEFIPGQIEKAAIVIYPTDSNGVGIAPIYLKNLACDKPESFKDEDIVEVVKKASSGGSPPSSAGAGSASPSK
jgi:hypothetical protein